MQTSRLVELALKGLEAERARIDREIAELRMQGKATPAGRTRTARRRTHRLTAAGRKRLSDMMKARWAERRKAAAKK